MSELIEIAPGRFRFARPQPAPKRSDLPLPYVISDTMPAVEQVDGRYYESKRAFRAVGRANGLTEVGNERLKQPKWRSTDKRETKVQRRRALEKAVAEYAAGRRPKV